MFTNTLDRTRLKSECMVLGVATSDAWEVVKAKYRRLAHEFHPDKHEEGDPESAEKTVQFHKIQEAFEYLEVHKAEFELPEPEFILIEGVTAYIKYERTSWGSVLAYLEINIDDVPNLKWYPVPTHANTLKEVRVVRDGVQVVSQSLYGFEKVNELRTKVATWRASQLREEASSRLQPRMSEFEWKLKEMDRLDRPTVRLVNLVRDARNAHSGLKSHYQPTNITQVEKIFDQVDAEIERLRQGGPLPIVEDLLDGVLYHQDEDANQAVIDAVRSWHIRTKGFIDLIDEPMLRAFYERRIISGKVNDVRYHTDLRLKLENFVDEELIEELDVVAPATIELSSSKGLKSYLLKYDYFERDGHLMPVAIVTLPLRVYEHNAPEYGKPSKLPVLPFGIQLYVEILFDNKKIFAGMPGEDLEKKVTKFNKYRNGSKTGHVDVGIFSMSLRVAPTPLPPWFKGKPPRY